MISSRNRGSGSRETNPCDLTNSFTKTAPTLSWGKSISQALSSWQTKSPLSKYAMTMADAYIKSSTTSTVK